MLSVEEIHLKIPAGGVLTLPNTIRATFSDDSYRPAQVNWVRPDPSALKQVGRIEVAGTVFGYEGPVKAIVDIVADVNPVPDSSFESGKLDPGWVLAGDGAGAATLVEKNPSNAHSSDYSFKYWLDTPFQFTLTRRLTGLKDGKYSFRAWAMGGGGEKDYYLFARGYGGPDLSAKIVNTGWTKWKLYEITGIPVSGGEGEIGLSMDRASATGATWTMSRRRVWIARRIGLDVSPLANYDLLELGNEIRPSSSDSAKVSSIGRQWQNQRSFTTSKPGPGPW